MAAFLEPEHGGGSLERCSLFFHCSIKLRVNVFHLLARSRAKRSQNTKVFIIMAVECGLARGHFSDAPLVAWGRLELEGYYRSHMPIAI